MTPNQPQQPAQTADAHPAAGTERAVALATTFTPLATGILAPFLDGGAAFTATFVYGAAAGITTTNYMNRLPAALRDNLPGQDIATAHRQTLFAATVTTGVALAAGTLLGPVGTDALLAGALDPLTIPGIVSLGWWAGFFLVPVKLRRILKRPRAVRPTPTAAHAGPGPAVTAVRRRPMTPVGRILDAWARALSNPKTGTHKRQHLTITRLTANQLTGHINAPAGAAVTITADNISSALAPLHPIRPEWIQLRPGAHAGEQHLTIDLTAPPELDTSTLAGAWTKWVARSGGLMTDTHLEDVQHDPNTGGQCAYVIAGESINKLPVPDRAELAGALRTNTLLCSYNPVPGNPRRGEIRTMETNPLQEGVPFPGTHVLKASEGGYVQIGRHVSGFPARIQFTDPKLGAKHLFIAGVTGSGKGGTVQIVALADHVNGHAIIYGDPKGSSNPDVETMACYSGLGHDGVMGALRVIYALLQWRIKQSADLKMKNFIPTPDRPWVRFILDEAHVPLTELDHHKKEAGIIVEALAAEARSLGIIVTVVNQAVNADKVGGSTALRMNVIQGGSLVMLRSDSGQQHLVTTGFEGVDPGEIPATWDDEERPLVYNTDTVLKDPKATYGIGYTLGPGGAAEMMRTFVLESAAEYIDHDAIAYPADWPDWDRRHDIAAVSILDNGDSDDLDDFGSFAGPSALPLPPAPKKPTSAADKLAQALAESADPLGLETTYLHKDQLAAITGIKGTSTLNNALTGLVRDGIIHRQMVDGKERVGFYGHGPEPTAPPAAE